ncbi:two-component system sensor histidine kinase DesK [Motilibacter peucedani]|uniref:Two-component system sensor histidine kinase DesK n=1 Tax=Motilibacter peucedani TaxID=598650 RepID=A0A420XP38_9ACTN|nr:histidine kinase [Motilibacter peucedani]RKS73957.1 two-component system sensor histidine kinase DesK [Motilibacter peucedani]
MTGGAQSMGVLEPPPRLRWVFAAVWLVYLQQAFAASWHSPSVVARWVSLTALTVFAVTYLLVFRWGRTAIRSGVEVTPRGWYAVAGMTGLALLTLPGAGEDGLATTVYLAASVMLLLPRVHRLVALALLLASAWLAQVLVPGWSTDGGVLLGTVLAAVATGGVLKVVERNRQLAHAHEEIARLAVAEERSRMARDLHDILGHSLTVITVKAELAGRLLEADPTRVAAEVHDIERLSREALTDVRATISGQRTVTLTGEIAGARAALAGAGIEADLPTAVDEVPGSRRELFGWAVREGVTNVVRHSGARHCRVRVRADGVEIVDDGRGPCPGGGAGSGLAGLRERVRQAGGEVAVGRASESGGFALRVELPAARA